jgi:hypothetical protein
MRIAKAQQSSRQVVVGLGEWIPQGERMPVRRHTAVEFVQIHKRVAELQTGSGVSWFECQSLLEARRCLTDPPALGVKLAQSVPVIWAERLNNDHAVQCGDRVLSSAGLMEKRR